MNNNKLAMTPIYENKSVKFFFDPETRIFRANFYGLVEMNSIIEAFNFIISNPKPMNAVAVLSDLSNLKGTFTMLMDYFEDKLYPFLNSRGILCDAMILNSDVFTKFSVKKLETAIDAIKIKSFENEESAIQWINFIIKKQNK